MLQEPNIEQIGPQHQGLLAMLALNGIDTTPVVGGAARFIGYGDTKHGYGPACLLDLLGTEHVVEPHVVWFPWTGQKHRMMHFKWVVNLLKKTHHILFNVEKSQIALFEHYAKKGLLRKIGFIEDLPIVHEIHMYQVKKEPAHE